MSKLYTPIKIGSLELRNRIAMSAMDLRYDDKGKITNKLIEFHRLRARGGVGLIMLGGMQFDPIRIADKAGFIKIYDDAFIPGLRRYTDAVHNEGAKTFAQLLHPGRNMNPTEYSGITPVSPSEVINRYKVMTHALTEQEIADLVGYYASAAARAVSAGFDGIEICTNSSHLPGQFMSAYTNKRTDRYGGDLEGRMTFMLEVVAAIRGAVGASIPISVRVGGNDYVAGGNTNAQACQIAVYLEKAGVNAIAVTGGWHEAKLPQITMDVPHGALSYLGRGIKESVSIPVLMSNRMDIPTAERLVDDGVVDMVAMARPFIADPELVNKAIQGSYKAIRPCLGCNQGCFDLYSLGQDVTCLGNAEAGRESELLQGGSMPSQVKSPGPEKILLIGAGPGGMEYARVAAQRGHSVTVWEQQEKAGGQIETAAAPPGRHAFAKLGEYLLDACDNLGVQFVYNKKATKDEVLERVRAGDFDRVVIAVGASPITPNIPTEEGAYVVQAWDVLNEKVKVGDKIVIIGGGAVGAETAIMLAQIGTIDGETLRHLMTFQAETPEELYRLITQGTKQVTVMEMEKSIGKDIGISSRWTIIDRLKKFNVTMRKNTKAVEIRKDGVLAISEDGEILLEADTVVLAIGSRANDSLYKELEGAIPKLDIIGDAVRPKKILDAVRAAYDSAITV